MILIPSWKPNTCNSLQGTELANYILFKKGVGNSPELLVLTRGGIEIQDDEPGATWYQYWSIIKHATNRS